MVYVRAFVYMQFMDRSLDVKGGRREASLARTVDVSRVHECQMVT